MIIDHANHDNSWFFKSIDRDWFDRWDGDVESPSGWYGKVFIDQKLIDHHIKDFPDDETELDSIKDIPLDEYYFIAIDSNGLVWAYTVSADDDDSINGMYARAETQYYEWAREEDDEYEDFTDEEYEAQEASFSEAMNS